MMFISIQRMKNMKKYLLGHKMSVDQENVEFYLTLQKFFFLFIIHKLCRS